MVRMTKKNLSSRMTTAAPLIDDITLRDMAADVLQDSGSGHQELKAFRRVSNPQSTLFPTELVHVETTDGEERTMFVKHLLDRHRPGEDPHPDSRLDREVRLYEGLGFERVRPMFLMHCLLETR